MDSLNVPTKSLQGKSIDLTEQAKALNFEPKFRAMVIQAARRLLKSRGVQAIISSPKSIAPEPGEEA